MSTVRRERSIACALSEGLSAWRRLPVSAVFTSALVCVFFVFFIVLLIVCARVYRTPNCLSQKYATRHDYEPSTYAVAYLDGRTLLGVGRECLELCDGHVVPQMCRNACC